MTIVGALALVAAAAAWFLFRYVPSDEVGVVEMRWSARGSVRSGLIALGGEAGFQPAVLRGGVHRLPRLKYAVHRTPLVTIPQGRIGYVFARDGAPLPPEQSLASNAVASDFEDVAAFLRAGGQRGPQRRVLREGTYALNLAQFVVLTEDRVYGLSLDRGDRKLFDGMRELVRARDGFEPVVIRGGDDRIGIVTVHDGPSLPEGEIIAPIVGVDVDGGSLHRDFQDPEAFLRTGGRRGRQLHVLADGTYYLNRLFATVELVPKTTIEVGCVGVVVWYAGAAGKDVSGTDYKHGELVGRGERGVWSAPLLPGKYPFNTYAGRVVSVPTTNFILKWIRTEQGAHRFDENLAEVSLITKDAFEPSLPLSVVVHIDYRQAPLVVQRFGDIRRLVEQTLDPMVSAYFKNVGQTRTLIQLLQDRSEIQRSASAEMREKFAHYNLELEEVLIGTPTAPPGDQRIEEILAQLRARQIAEERAETFGRQQQTAVRERELREAEAHARVQQALTESELSIRIQGNQGRADYERAVQEAARIRCLAEAEAEKTARLGAGQAAAIADQVRAYGGPRFLVARELVERFAAAVERSGVDVVPKIVVGGGGAEGRTGGLLDTLLALLSTERFGGALAAAAGASRATPAAEPPQAAA
jgi:uncharacterized membrane protein YqiK